MSFASYHPIINFVYFTLVFIFSMFFMHPVCLGISLACAFTYSIMLKGQKALRLGLLYMFPMMLIAALLNPVFNHEGVTILAYLPSGNPLTFESIAFGLGTAVMIAAVICWFSCFNVIMTNDKFIYLFGRIIPSLSLIISMTLRFVPKFKAQIKVIYAAQKGIGRDMSNGSIVERAKNGITILSIMITWALENAIETADSMRARGYGLPGRTAFSIFTFDKRDGKALAVILILGIYVLLGGLKGGMHFVYFPSMKGIGVVPYSVSVFLAYFLLCIIPVTIEVMEEKSWKSLRSKI